MNLFDYSHKPKWQMPASLPRLDAAKMIAIDCETRDKGINAGLGVGARRKDSYIAGLAIGTEDGRRWYFPMRHEQGANFAPDVVARWAREELGREHQPKIGMNLLYDLDYLHYEGIKVKGTLHDVMLAEPLIDEHARSYALKALASKYLDEDKVSDGLAAWCSQAFGGANTLKAQAKNIWRAPAHIVGPYAEGDVDLPFRIFEHQKVALEKEQLFDVYRLECDLLPMLLAMRVRGVRIDMSKADALATELDSRSRADTARLNDIAGREINIHANDDLAIVFDKLGIEYPRTQLGTPSFTKPWLENHAHDITQLIVNARKWHKFKGTFIDGYIGKYAINGRLHAEFNQLRSDESGTVSGRFSSSNPNLQNIPARDPELGKLVRSLFLPDEGEQWYSLDYSQIEYRIMVHYAKGDAAEAVREEYRRNPNTDYHALVQEWTGLDRKPAKNLNFGVIFGMGINTMCNQFGWSREQAQRFLTMYDAHVPFARGLLRDASQIAQSRGYVKTLLGRRARFPHYEPVDGCGEGYLSLAEAERKWAGKRLRRACTHKALNCLTQGGGADMLKRAMLDIWQSGACDIVGAPLLTVHDELCWSVPDSSAGREAMAEVKQLMECAIKLSIPVYVDMERGDSWGELKNY